MTPRAIFIPWVLHCLKCWPGEFPLTVRRRWPLPSSIYRIPCLLHGTLCRRFRSVRNRLYRSVPRRVRTDGIRQWWRWLRISSAPSLIRMKTLWWLMMGRHPGRPGSWRMEIWQSPEKKHPGRNMRKNICAWMMRKSHARKKAVPEKAGNLSIQRMKKRMNMIPRWNVSQQSWRWLPLCWLAVSFSLLQERHWESWIWRKSSPDSVLRRRVRKWKCRMWPVCLWPVPKRCSVGWDWIMKWLMRNLPNMRKTS